ncbi:mandelate racemase/muconate lactonizing enzyme family protein [Chloroflexota bacterium]
MKITDVKAYAIHMPFIKGDLPTSLRTFRTPVIVKVSTDEGITGVGEAFGYFNSALATVRAVEDMLSPILVGEDPMEIQKLWDQMYRAVYYAGRMGITISAISGVEIALWDIVGKASNTPLYQLLGGRAHDKLRAYASLARYPNPEDVAQACATIVEKGYTAIKLHEIDVAAVAAARKAVGDDVDILLDVNCTWDVSGAIEMGKQFEPFNLYWYEEPVWPGDDYEGLAEVRVAVNIPIAAGENEYTARGFNGLIAKRSVDFLQPSVFKLGGILQEKKVFTLAEAFSGKVAPHCMAYGPAMAATVHICFSEPSCELVETGVETPEANIFTQPLLPDKGFWSVPDGPGLGIELDEHVLTKYSML